MQKKNATVHLLILDPSQNDAESMVSLLRNSGKATRAHRITSEEDLEEALKTSNWDLLLARDLEQEFGPDDALAMVKRMDKDIPFVLLTEEVSRERTVNIIRAGGQDAVPFEYKDLLVLVVKRELAALEERRRRRVLESHLREAEQRCQLLLESSKDAIAYINDGMHIYANQSYMEFLGYDDIDDLICIPVLDTLTPESQDKYKDFMKAFADDGKDGMTLNCTARRSDDQELNVTMSVSAATYDGEACTQIVLQPEHSDAELEEKLKQISSQDLLTGLYNRQYLMDALAQAIANAGKNNQTGALAYIALDNFISMKGQVGIAGADLLLGDLASLLKEQAGEEVTLARLSDDAFCLMCLPCDEKHMESIAERVRKAVEDHLFDINGKTVPLTVSIGVAAITENSPKAEELMGRAHIASAEVKKLEGHERGNGIVVYNPAQYESLDESNSVEAILKALDDNRFRLLFQPIINLRGEGEEHYEAFVRMLDKDNEEVSPYDFLPPMGPSDTAIKIDRWVILQTIKQLASHRSRGHDTRLFLNITAETLQDKTFTPWLSVALKAARLPGDSLIFQIREGDANNYMKQAKEFTKAVHELHSKVSIAQFGCALNPFNTLKHIDADYVKIDGSFTEEIQKSDEAKEQVKEMVKSLQNAGKLTIIPLVENASVLATLWQAGVNYIQGYYLQAPVPEMNYDFGDH
ncbi:MULTISPECIES: GGDEF domain-containing response regulator [unclassified Marinobacter]|uniref:EAL domain-containing response regulator n=1 Tax=unclassified Marinobacter TaxID=83889 RepID=UPI000718EABC|nr:MULTISPECIES: GGDEF domain-containing response regulator [unclassified Marinobacter]MDX5440410.1 GGDEF domain-containing response regulator [Alteromonadaceae bacterium]AMQ88130.1 diguanylate cyclase [Marinobacter sp. LQ44]MDX5335335.1 GGDEF domain-containing response regulator [Marinobacter sp.]MDX5386131.1 GGDEF domain-containing response regulator [Marinobacter sp.]MDX5471639.1 GGDEF domain-containing response regulator [Marinobacter sp.]